MSAVPIFHGSVSEKGVLLVSVGETDRRRLYLRSLAGHPVEIIIRKERTKRSLDMNAYLHAVPFRILAEELGDSIEGVKFDLMGEFWGWRVTKAGHRLPVKGHTSEMTVDESARFVDWLVPFALTKFGVVIPLPNEAAA